MKILQCQSDLCDVKQRNIIWEYVFFPEQPEYLSPLHEVEHEVEIDLVLESLDKINDERVRGPSQNVLFIFDVVNLFEFYDLLFMQHFQSVPLAIQDSQVDFTEGPCSDNPHKLVVGDLPLSVLHLSSVLVGLVHS